MNSLSTPFFFLVWALAFLEKNLMQKMTDHQKVDRDIERAALNYKHSDDGRWAAAFFAARVVGRYELGATIRLSNRMGKSVDTVENLAHAYFLYAELRADPRYHRAVREIRKLPFMYYSYWRALWKAKQDYRLTLEQVWDILIDMMHAEGSLHLSHLEVHIRDRFGDRRTWDYWGARALKEISQVLNQPDVPDDVKATLIPAYNKLGEL